MVLLTFFRDCSLSISPKLLRFVPELILLGGLRDEEQFKTMTTRRQCMINADVVLRLCYHTVLAETWDLEFTYT